MPDIDLCLSTMLHHLNWECQKLDFFCLCRHLINTLFVSISLCTSISTYTTETNEL